jgi:hypothetical protein
VSNDPDDPRRRRGNRAVGGQSLISHLAAMFGVFGGLNADDGMPAGL